jgi:hypothetical protein
MTRAETCALTHLLDWAHSPTPNAAGTRVYVVCNWQGCQRRRDVGTEAWEAEVARRVAMGEGEGALQRHGEPAP